AEKLGARFEHARVERVESGANGPTIVLADGTRRTASKLVIAAELGGIDRPPNFARSKAMLEKAKRFLPGLDPSGGREWMGYRPSLPDSLPVIGAARAPNVYYAFGHGHLGLTQSAATGRLIRDLILGQTPPLDLTPFRAQRF
ncbi:MAG: FAD-dependent oxidoreductase, partial [Mesorhizobium sp.]